MSVCTSLRQAASPSGSASDDSGTYDSGTVSSIDSLLGPERVDPDFRIRQRLEASRQGMLQLDLLRRKHQKLMQEMRLRLAHVGESAEVKSRVKRAQLTTTSVPVHHAENAVCTHQRITTGNTYATARHSRCDTEIHSTEHNKNNNNSFWIKLEDSRCDSPVSCCVSHRSSVSMDSGCVSISSDPRVCNFSTQSPMSYSTYRKLSIEERCKQFEQHAVNDENQRIVATAIESTTALRCRGAKRYVKNWQRPKSMCAAFPEENSVLVDSRSFSQITPPPIHRKFTTVARCESVQTRRPYMAGSCLDVRPTLIKDSPVAPTRFAVNQSPVLQAKPSLFVPPTPSSPPHIRIRNPQKPPQPMPRVSQSEPQSIFHASRVFVDRSPRNARQRPKSMYNLERVDSDEDSAHLAQPAIVISRQQSYARSNENSPSESRKFHVIETSQTASNITLFGQQHYQLNRCESSQSSETMVAERPRRRTTPEKDWKESEGL
ncbi:hypothetical protein Tcan_14914 [Toxocara canis]|uniref:Uncharacterized protein n=1 Tax=Toxocara canis TaxID=6265 RepID=A0A0B2V569_TOXCA|nr:hypothetical protein Tcan_14914 [Toxocara canis]